MRKFVRNVKDAVAVASLVITLIQAIRGWHALGKEFVELTEEEM